MGDSDAECDEEIEQQTFEEETITVVEQSTGHRRYEVPISDVDRECVSLVNAELVEEKVHNDPMAYVRDDTREEVDRRD